MLHKKIETCFIVKESWIISEAVVQRCSVKKEMPLEISQNSQENTCARVSFSIKLQDWVLQLYFKNDFGTGIFLRILRNF